MLAILQGVATPTFGTDTNIVSANPHDAFNILAPKRNLHTALQSTWSWGTQITVGYKNCFLIKLSKVHVNLAMLMNYEHYWVVEQQLQNICIDVLNNGANVMFPCELKSGWYNDILYDDWTFYGRYFSESHMYTFYLTVSYSHLLWIYLHPGSPRLISCRRVNYSLSGTDQTVAWRLFQNVPVRTNRTEW